MTKQQLDIMRHKITGRKKYLAALLKTVKEVRAEITQLEADYEEAEHEYLFRGKE